MVSWEHWGLTQARAFLAGSPLSPLGTSALSTPRHLMKGGRRGLVVGENHRVATTHTNGGHADTR